MDNKIDLRGKHVLITGGSRGIGAAVARSMAACGARILINHYDDAAAAEALASEITAAGGTEALVYGADVSRHDEVVAMFAFADLHFGKMDILVNNAGCETIEHAADMKMEDWDRVLDVNLKGSFICTQQAAKRMMESRAGVVINISSIHDKVPRKGLMHYCASKAGVTMMAKCWALELAAFNIRVVTVSPGAIETDMNKEEISAFGRERFNHWIPAGRIGIVDEVAWTCAFLACNKASYITAETIYIDGGYKESTIAYDPRPQK